MISVIFPPGAYGNFLSSCLYMFTELSDSDYNFKFGIAGDSHIIRSNKDYRSKIQVTHLPYMSGFDENRMTPDKTVIILADQKHLLDYFDNQFTKQHDRNLPVYVQTLFSNAIVNEKLEKFNTNLECFDNWQMREYISFWINECLLADTDLYSNTSGHQISSSELFNVDFVQTFSRIASYLGYNVINTQDLVTHHKKFVELQKFDNIQLKCEQWATDVLAGKNFESPCVTIFDEAYVQHLLRKSGFEIKCYQLNEFPRNSKDLYSLLYPAN